MTLWHIHPCANCLNGISGRTELSEDIQEKSSWAYRTQDTGRPRNKTLAKSTAMTFALKTFLIINTKWQCFRLRIDKGSQCVLR